MALGSGNIELDVSARLDTSGLVRQVSAAERQLRPLNLRLDDRGFRQPLGRITGDMAEFQKSLDASVARTLAFGAAVGVLNSVADGFKAMVTNAAEVEKALADINVILNLSSSALSQFSSDLFDVAKNTGQAFEAVSEAAVELSRQGLGAEETLKRINDAMILTRLSGMDAAKSVETLTAAVNSFGSTALTTTDLVNKLATVDAAFAVSTEDLANALARAGSTAQGAKVNLEELLAAVTSVQQTTARGGSVIGNAFKSIFTRIQRSKVRESLEEIGVATTDAAGNIRGALDIIKDYANIYDNLTDAQKAYTDELVAGVFQINNFKALVKDLAGDYSIYDRALKQANGATDEAIRRNEKLQGTLTALINESAVNVKELSAALGELVATPAVENLLKIFNKVAGSLTGILEGDGMIKKFFVGIGKFISGPGLVIITFAFVKLFKFITSQATSAIGEIFTLGKAKDKIADAEAKIGFLLKNNYALYEAISNEALDHKQKEELVLQTLKAQNQAYKTQQNLISSLASNRAIQAQITPGAAQGYVPRASKGFIPNFANGVEGAMESERRAISQGVGGASKSAKPKVIKNFPMGRGKKQTIVANTDEVIVPNYKGGSGSAIFNKKMIKQAGGKPKGAIPVSRGFIPNFAKGKKTAAEPDWAQEDPYRKTATSQYGQENTPFVDLEAVLGGIGIIAAKGQKGVTQKIKPQSPSSKSFLGSTGVKNLINDIAGSNLDQSEKDFLYKRLEKIGKVKFSNIGVSSISELDQSTTNKVAGISGAIDDVIGPYIANATAAASRMIYSSILGDEVKANDLQKSVLSGFQKGDLKKIVTVDTEGSIFEAAIRLGSKESSKNFGGDPNAIWDFEENGSVTEDMKKIFFDSIGYTNVVRADAKRVASDSMITEVIEKAYQSEGNTTWMRDKLKEWHEAHYRPLVESAVATKNLAGGFIPNFAYSKPVTNPLPSTDRYYKKGRMGIQLPGVHSAIQATMPAVLYNEMYQHWFNRGFRPLNEEVDLSGLKSFGLTTSPTSKDFQRANNLLITGEDPDYTSLPYVDDIGRILRGKGLDSIVDNSKKWPQPNKEYSSPSSEADELVHDRIVTEIDSIAAPPRGGKIGSFDLAMAQVTDDKIAQHITGLNFLTAKGHSLNSYGGGAQLMAHIKSWRGTQRGANLRTYEPAGNTFGSMGEYDATQGKFIPKAGSTWDYNFGLSEYIDTNPIRLKAKISPFTIKNALSPAFSGGTVKGSLIDDKFKSIAKGTHQGFDGTPSIPPALNAAQQTFFEQSNFSATVKDLRIHDPNTGKDFSKSDLVNRLGWNEYDFEKAINDYPGGGYGISRAAEAPLDFNQGARLGEAKYGAGAKTTPAEIYGKLLRYKLGNNLIANWPPTKPDNYNLGNLDLIQAVAEGFIPNFSTGSSQLDHYNKTSYGRHGAVLDFQSFFPKSGTLAIGTLFKDVMAMAQAGTPYKEIRAGEIIGPRIPKMLVTAKKFLDKKRAEGLKQPPMDIHGYFDAWELIDTLGKNKHWYNLEKNYLEERGREFKPSAPGSGINKASVATKYVPEEEKALLGSFRDLGLPVDERDAFGGFKQFDRYYLKNLPMFKNGFAKGFVPNLAEGNMVQGLGRYSEIYDNENHYSGERSLDIGYISSGDGSGIQTFRNLLEVIVNAAKEGRPFTHIDGGSIVGTRIPTVLVKSKKLLDRMRSQGVDIPFMKVSGFMRSPSLLLDKLQNRKEMQEERGTREIGKHQYNTGEEKQLVKSLLELGLDPESKEMVFLEELPMMQQFASGYVPSYADIDDRKRAAASYESIKTKDWTQLKESGKQVRKRILNASRFFPLDPQSAMRTMYKDVVSAGDSERPYTDIEAGEIVGPRIPNIIVRAKEMLDRARGKGKTLPLMNIDGQFEPTWLMGVMERHKNEYDQGISGGSNYYYPGEEDDLLKSLTALGADPESPVPFELANSPLFANGFANGFVPNFKYLYQPAEKDTGAGSKQFAGRKKVFTVGGAPVRILGDSNTYYDNPKNLYKYMDSEDARFGLGFSMLDKWQKREGTNFSIGSLRYNIPNKTFKRLLGKGTGMAGQSKVAKSLRGSAHKYTNTSETYSSLPNAKKTKGADGIDFDKGVMRTGPYDNKGWLKKYGKQYRILSSPVWNNPEALMGLKLHPSQGEFSDFGMIRKMGTDFTDDMAMSLINGLPENKRKSALKTLYGMDNSSSEKFKENLMKVSGQSFSQGFIPSFIRGLFDSDYIPAGEAKSKNKIVDSIINGSLPFDVFHGPPGAGKSTLARNMFPHELITSLQHFEDMKDQWTEFSVVSGTRPSRTLTKQGAKPGLAQYTPRAQNILTRARKIFALTPDAKTLDERRAHRANIANLAEEDPSLLPDKRSASQLKSASEGSWLPSADLALYDELEKMGKDVVRTASGGFIPNFAIDSGILGRMDKDSGYSETTRSRTGPSKSTVQKLLEYVRQSTGNGLEWFLDKLDGFSMIEKALMIGRKLLPKNEDEITDQLSDSAKKQSLIDRLKSYMESDDGGATGKWAEGYIPNFNSQKKKKETPTWNKVDESLVRDLEIQAIMKKKNASTSGAEMSTKGTGFSSILKGSAQGFIHSGAPSGEGGHGIHQKDIEAFKASTFTGSIENFEYQFLDPETNKISKLTASRLGELLNAKGTGSVAQAWEEISAIVHQNPLIDTANAILDFEVDPGDAKAGDRAQKLDSQFLGKKYRYLRTQGTWSDIRSNGGKKNPKKAKPWKKGTYNLGDIIKYEIPSKASGLIPNFANKLQAPTERFYIPQEMGAALLGNEEYNRKQILGAIEDAFSVTGASPLSNVMGSAGIASEYARIVNSKKDPFLKEILNESANFDGEGPDGNPFKALYVSDVSNALKGLELLGYKKGKYQGKKVGMPKLGLPNKESSFQASMSAALGFVPNFALGKLQSVKELPNAPDKILEDIISELIFDKYEQPIRMGSKGRYRGKLNEDQIDNAWWQSVMLGYKTRTGDPSQRFFLRGGLEPPVNNANVTTKEINDELRKGIFNPDTGKAELNLQRAAGGLIPNFANALQEAIGREKKALKSQGSNAKIYVDQDRRLKNSQNPLGLLVANKRDEPRSGSQGVDRAIANRMDPRRHGAARGLIPNFASELTPDQKSSRSGMMDLIKWMEEVGDAAEEAAQEGDEQVRSLREQISTYKELVNDGDSNEKQLEQLGQSLQNFFSEANKEILDFQSPNTNLLDTPNLKLNDRSDEKADLNKQAEDIRGGREKVIQEFNKLAEAIAKGAKDLNLPDEELAAEIEKLGALDKKLKDTFNVDTTQAMKTGALKTLDLGSDEKAEAVTAKVQGESNKALLRQSEDVRKSIEKEAKAKDKLARSSQNALAKIMGIQMGISQFSAMTDIDTTGFQSALGIFQGIESVVGQDMVNSFGKFLGMGQKGGPILQGVTMALGIAYDAYNQFLDGEKLAIKALDEENKLRGEAIDIITQNIEKIDSFADVTAKFADAAETGKVETAGKFMQKMFASAQDVAALDPKAFEDVINAMGDTEKFNQSIEDFKKAADAGKSLKLVEQDIGELMKTINQDIDSQQFMGIKELSGTVIPDFSKFKNQIEGMGKMLTQNLSDDAALNLNRALDGFDIYAHDSADTLMSLQGVFGDFDEATKRNIQSQPKLAQGILEQVKIQNQYQAAVIRAKTAFEVAQKPIVVLNNRLNDLATALDVAAQSSKSAFDTLMEVGKIQGTASVESMSLTGTVSQRDVAVGQAASNIRNSEQQAQQDVSSELKSFASTMLKGSKEGTTVLSSSMQGVISGIENGSVSNESAMSALLEAQKNGNPDEKEAANKTIESLRAINQAQIKDTAITNANLKAQLQKMDAQAVNTQRTVNINESQLKGFQNMSQGFDSIKNSSSGIMNKISEMTSTIGLLESMGADSGILSELKESNAQLNQLEALRAAIESTTGESFESTSLSGLSAEIDDFVRSNAFDDLEGAAADTVLGIRSATRKGVDMLDEAGVKSSADVEEASVVRFSDASLTSLSSTMAEAVSSALASSLNIGEGLANEINSIQPDIDVLSSDIDTLSASNDTNSEENLALQKELNTAMIDAMKAAEFGQLASSSDSLERAAETLERAANIMIENNSASGFIPNFAPMNPVSKALNTERKMGAKSPVVDSHPSVGTYVRDAATQSNFAAVRRDHPEGIHKAISNSAKIQGVAARGFTPNFASMSSEEMAEILKNQQGANEREKRVAEYLRNGGPTTVNADSLVGWSSIKSEVYRQTGLGKEDPLSKGYSVDLDYPPYEVLTGSGNLGAFDPVSGKVWLQEFPQKGMPPKAIAEMQSVLANESIHWIQNKYRKELGEEGFREWLVNKSKQQQEALGIEFAGMRYAESFKDIGYDRKAGAYAELLKNNKIKEEELLKRFNLKDLKSIPSLEKLMKMGSPAEAWLLNDLSQYVPGQLAKQEAIWKSMGLTHQRASGIKEITSPSGVERGRTGYLIEKAKTNWPKFRKTGDPLDLELGKFEVGPELNMILNDPDFREFWFDENGSSKFLKDPMGTLRSIEKDFGKDSMAPLYSLIENIQSVNKTNKDTGTDGYTDMHNQFTDLYNTSIAKLLQERMSHMASIGIRNLQKEKGGGSFSPLASGFIPNFAPTKGFIPNFGILGMGTTDEYLAIGNYPSKKAYDYLKNTHGYSDGEIGPVDADPGITKELWLNALFGTQVSERALAHPMGDHGSLDRILPTSAYFTGYSQDNEFETTSSRRGFNRNNMYRMASMISGKGADLEHYWTLSDKANILNSPIINYAKLQGIVERKTGKEYEAIETNPFREVSAFFKDFNPLMSIKGNAAHKGLADIVDKKSTQSDLGPEVRKMLMGPDTFSGYPEWVERWSTTGRRLETPNDTYKRFWDSWTSEDGRTVANNSHISQYLNDAEINSQGDGSLYKSPWALLEKAFAPSKNSGARSADVEIPKAVLKLIKNAPPLGSEPRTKFKLFDFYKDSLEKGYIGARFLEGTAGSASSKARFKNEEATLLLKDLEGSLAWGSKLIDGNDSVSRLSNDKKKLDMMRHTVIGQEIYESDGGLDGSSGLSKYPEASNFLSKLHYANSIKSIIRNPDQRYLIPVSFKRTKVKNNVFEPLEGAVGASRDYSYEYSKAPAYYSESSFNQLIQETQSVIEAEKIRKKLASEEGLMTDMGVAGESNKFSEKLAQGNIDELIKFKKDAERYLPFFSRIKEYSTGGNIEKYFEKPFWVDSASMEIKESDYDMSSVKTLPRDFDFQSKYNYEISTRKGSMSDVSQRYDNFVKSMFPEDLLESGDSSIKSVKEYLKGKYGTDLPTVLANLSPEHVGMESATLRVQLQNRLEELNAMDLDQDNVKLTEEEEEVTSGIETKSGKDDQATGAKGELMAIKEARRKKLVAEKERIEKLLKDEEDTQAKIKEVIDNIRATSRDRQEAKEQKDQGDFAEARDELYRALLGGEARKTRDEDKAKDNGWIKRRDFAEGVMQRLSSQYIPNLIRPIESRLGIVSKSSFGNAQFPTFNVSRSGLLQNTSTTRQDIVPHLQNKLAALKEAQQFYSGDKTTKERQVAYLMKINDAGGMSTGFLASLQGSKFSPPAGWEDEGFWNKYKEEKAIYESQSKEELHFKDDPQEMDNILEHYSGPISRQKNRLMSFAEIQTGNRWVKRFEAADGGKAKAAYLGRGGGTKYGAGQTERGKLLKSIGLAPSGLIDAKEFYGDNKNAIGFTPHDILNSIAGATNDEGLSFLMHEVNAHKGDIDFLDQDFASGLINRLKSINIPWNDEMPPKEFLKSQKLDFIEWAGSNGPQVGPAINADRANNLINKIQQIQKKDIISTLKEWDPKRFDYSEDASFAEILGAGENLSNDDLYKNPHFLKYKIGIGKGDSIKKEIKLHLDSAANIENAKEWQKAYTTTGGDGKVSLLKGGAPYSLLKNDRYGIAQVSDDIIQGRARREIDENPFGGNEPRLAIIDAIEEVTRAENAYINNIINGNHEYPFPKIANSKGAELDSANREALKEWFYQNFGKDSDYKNKMYYPFGYSRKFGRTEPPIDPNRLSALLGDIARWGLVQKENENNKEEGQEAANARGFVPNFSKVAGEIAASRAAGYKTPVRPSQVKSMSIPGVGRTSYNTQESVFKAKGMTQPFIRPPADSKAAKPYAKKVQSKFNFNPYGKRAADGFVPNFAPTADGSAFEESTKRFSDSVGLFERFGSSLKEAFDGIDFSQLASASNSILEASKEFTNQSKNIKDAAQSIAEANTTNNPNVNIDFTDINNAASTISESFNQLSRQLSSPVVLDSSSFETAAGNLQNISITVTVPEVQVNVQGAGAAANQIKDAVGKEVQAKIQDSLSNTNFASKEEINRSLGTNL